MKPVFYTALIALLGCHGAGIRESVARGHLIVPSEQTPEVSWSGSEQGRPLAIRNLRRSEQASFHLFRVAGEAPPVMHERSDMVLMMVAGSVTLTLGESALALTPGDVVEIPRGTPYAMKNTGSEAGIAYVVQTPPLAADDQRPPPSKSRDDVWKWNVWVQ